MSKDHIIKLIGHINKTGVVLLTWTALSDAAVVQQAGHMGRVPD